MDAKKPYGESAAERSLSTHLLNLPPPPRYETACGLSTRMIIDSASYTTTPCSSPPPEPSHVFSAHDTQHKVPDVAALAEASRVLENQMHQDKLGCHNMPTHQISNNQEQMLSGRTWYRQGIIPPYMLEAIAVSEAAGSQARASAEQTLLTSKSITRNRVSRQHFALTAPAQLQLKDGRWTIAS